MASTSFLVIIAALATVTNAANPLSKVVTLLEDMKTAMENEGKAEAATYAKFACFCKKTTQAKETAITFQITALQDEVDQLNADIGADSALRDEKIDKVQVEKQKKEATEIKLQKATKVYMYDKATFEEKDSDLSRALGATMRSLKALTFAKGTSFLAMGSSPDIREALNLADALGFVVPKKGQAVSTLLQSKVDPNDPEYKMHSHEIIRIITDLEKDFTKERDAHREEWKKVRASFKGEQSSMQGIMETSAQDIQTLGADVSGLKGKIAGENEKLINDKSSLAENSAYLRELTDRCQQKAQDFDQRTKLREDEVKSIADALTILKGKAMGGGDGAEVESDEDADLLERRPAVSAKAKHMLKKFEKQAAAKKTKAKAKSFLQTKTFLSSAVRVETSHGSKVQDILVEEGARLKSEALSALANQIQANPFGKVKKLIQGLTERLLAESKEEATKLGFCNTELGKSYGTRDAQDAAVSKIDTAVAALQAKSDVLVGDIALDKQELEDAAETLKEVREQRKETKSTNEDTLKGAREGAKATADAFVLLERFFNKKKAASLAQISQSPVEADLKKAGAGAGFEGKLKGKQMSAGVLALLETIQSDYEKTIKTTEASEAKDAAENVKFEQAFLENIAAKTKNKELNTEASESTTDAIKAGLRDLDTAQTLLDGALKNIEQLKPTCIDTGMSHADRTAKREQEIAALKKADEFMKKMEEESL